jgi:hypothetical protein
MNAFELTNQAIDEVRDNNKLYYARVMDFAEDWSRRQFKLFTSEDLKADFYSEGNEPPTQPAVFGAVFRKLSKEGLIFKHSTSSAKNKIAHQRLLQVWISYEFRLKQQKNRFKDKSGTQTAFF